MSNAETKGARRSVTSAGLAEAFARTAISVFYAAFAYAHFLAFRGTGRVSLVVIVAFESLFAVLYLTRKPASETSFRLGECIVAAGGSFAPLLLRPSPVLHDVLAGEVIQVVAAIASVWALVALNRRIGLLPANRGICSSGPYRYVRHPLYSTYTLGLIGYLISNWSARNAAIVVVGTCLQLARIVAEERLLKRDPAYREYAERTAWRVVPYVY